MTDLRQTLTVAVVLIFVSVTIPPTVAGGQNGANVAASRTYTWVTVGGSGHPDPAMAALITQAIEAQLTAKGLTKADGKSDLELECWVELKPEQLSISNGSDMNMGPGGVRSAPRTIPATETLRLDVYDTATKQRIWEGTITRTPNPYAKPEKQQKQIDKAVAKLLKNYPAPAK